MSELLTSMKRVQEIYLVVNSDGHISPEDALEMHTQMEALSYGPIDCLHALVRVMEKLLDPELTLAQKVLAEELLADIKNELQKKEQVAA